MYFTFIFKSKYYQCYKVLVFSCFILLLNTKLEAQKSVQEEYVILYAVRSNSIKPEVKYLLISTYILKASQGKDVEGKSYLSFEEVERWPKTIE